MTLREDIDTAVIGIFDDFDDVPLSFVLTRESTTNVLPGGEVVPGTTTTNGRLILDTDMTKEIAQGVAEIGDVKALVVVSELSLVPKSADVITVDSKDYVVRSFMKDPAGATYTIVMSGL